MEEQNLNPETLEILALLNYNYWCKDEIKKKELLDLYCKNDLKKEQELREKYNPDNLFKSKNKIEEKPRETSMIVVEKKGILNKIIKFIRKILNR